MAIRGAVGGLGDAATAQASSLTATFSGASTGDAAIVAVSTNTPADAYTTPSGWLLLGGSPYTQSANTKVYVFGRTALSAGEITSGVVFGGVTSGRLIGNGVILVGSVADFGNVTASTFAEAQAAASSVTAPSITTKQGLDDCVLLVVGRIATASTHPVITLPAAWTKQSEKATNISSSPNYTATGGYLTTPVAAASSVGGGSITSSPAALQLVAVVVEIMADLKGPLAGGTGLAFAPTVSGGSNPDGTVAATLATGSGQAFAPSAAGGASVLPPRAAGTGQAFAPALAGGATQLPPLAAGTGQAFAPTVSAVRSPTVAPPLAAGSGQGFAPAVSGGATVLAARAAGAGQAFAPTVGAVTDATVSPPRASGTAQAFAPTVSAGATVLPPRAAGTGAGPVPTVAAGATVAPPRASGTGQAFAPALTAGAVVSAPRATGTGAALDPLVVASAIVEAALAAMLGEAFPPAVSAFNPRDISVRSTLDGPDTSSSLTPYTVTAVLDRPTTRATLEDE